MIRGSGCKGVTTASAVDIFESVGTDFSEAALELTGTGASHLLRLCRFGPGSSDFEDGSLLGEDIVQPKSSNIPY